jgi:hypothetical protein
MLRRVDMDMDMDIFIAIDKLRCPCQTVLAKSLDAARCCKCCFIMNGTSGGRLAGGWLVGLATGSTLFAAKYASNQRLCMTETKREISGRSSASEINRLSPWDPRVLESLISDTQVFDFSMGWSND